MSNENENENDQEGKEGPSTLNTHERSLEEQLKAKEKDNADFPAKVVGEPLKPSENGHPIPSADVSADAEESVCTHVDSPRSSSANVDIVENQLDSVEPNFESVEAAAPLDLKDEGTENKNMDLSDYQRDIVEPIGESVEAAAPLGIEDKSATDKTVDISHNFGDLVEPIRQSVEGSVELVCESVENSVKHTQESVEATVSVDRKDEATAVENGGTTEVSLKEDEVDDSNLAASHLAIRDLVEPICESVEGSVELVCESVENSVKHMQESVEATVSVDSKDEASAVENGGTTKPHLKEDGVDDSNLAASHLQTGEAIDMAKVDNYVIRENKFGDAEDNQPAVQEEDASYMISYDDELENNTVESMKIDAEQVDAPTAEKGNSSTKHLFLFNENDEGSVSGTEEEQSLFMKELENSFKERNMEFKPPKFYGEGLNCLKLWRAVIGLGGYDRVTSNKLWRQVGESFRPPKTCTTVSWTFRGFYEKALLDFEREKIHAEEPSVQAPSSTESMGTDNQASGSARTPRDAAARARQGWHSQRLLGNDEVSDPIIKEKSVFSAQKREKQLKNSGSFKRKKQPLEEDDETTIQPKVAKTQVDVAVVDIGLPADWVKINVQKTMDCFEVYALVPGLLREEVRVQSDPAGRLVISGDPEQPDNPWGVTPFKKVITLPSKIDPHQTSAVVTLHGQLFVRVPFQLAEQ